MAFDLEIAQLSAKIDTAIVRAMEHEVADNVKAEMSKQIEQYTFTQSRGPHGMGVRDIRNFKATVDQNGDTTTLRVMDIAPFQSSQPRNKYLANVVETGDKTYKMPGPRPFMGPAEQEMGGGLFALALKKGLQKQGFTVV